MARAEGIWAAMGPQFEKALADDSVTAWVACSDELAYLALRFLEDHAVAVPQRLSVVGFDDLPDSLRHSLTSYNFNLDGLAYRMLSFLFEQPDPQLPHDLVSMEVAGMILERGTSGPPAQAGMRMSSENVRQTILIISGPNSMGSFFFASRQEPLIRCMERECHVRNISIRLCIQQGTGDIPLLIDNKTKTPIDFAQERGIIGIIILADVLGDCTALIELASTRNCPIAVVDERGQVEIPGGISNRVVRFILGFSPLCAQLVANYLLGLGHTRIAYLSHVHYPPWSKARLQGLIDICKERGLPDAVAAYTMEDEIDYYEFINVTKNEKCPVPSQIAAIKGLLDYLLAAKDEFGSRNERLVEKIFDTLGQICYQEFLGIVMQPLFAQALRDESITAWVCGNDNLATRATIFLRERGIAVPGRISVIGFDDLPDSFRYSLTSFNFNMVALGYKILSFLLDPGSFSTSHEAIPEIEVDGVIIERGTTRIRGQGKLE
jgi:DNA-binding LacI/PurR family transcriptional regulator